MNPNGLQVSTPTDTTIILLRTFAAPRRLVWEAMTTAEKMRRWMIAIPGWTLAVCECEARVGGVLRLEWRKDDADSIMTLKGVFTEAVPHERMVHTEKMEIDGSPIGSLLETHEFSENGGVTTMRITQLFDSKDARDGALTSGMDHGMEAGYKQLDAMLAQSA